MLRHGNASQLTVQEVLSLRVDRESELAACKDCLGVRGDNAFLWGERGIGKTFLVRLILDELHRDTMTLPVRVDALGLPGMGRRDPAAAFPEAILLGICVTIWKDVLRRPYSELRARLDLRRGDLRLASDVARTVERVYVQAMASQRKAHYEYSNSAGFSVGAKGEKRETGWLEQEQPPILPFEFLEYCEELLGALDAKGKTRVVILCDEANLLPMEQQRDILGRYVDLFTSRSVQFLFVAGVMPWDPFPAHVPEGFDLVLKLEGLEPEATEKLLAKVAHEVGVSLAAGVTDLVYTQFLGNPRSTIAALEDAVRRSRGSESVTLTTMETVCQELLARRDEVRQTTEAMRMCKPIAQVDESP